MSPRLRELLRHAWLQGLFCLSVGAGLWALGSGNRPVPIAAWLAPVFFLRFVRTHHRLGLLAAYAVHTAVALVIWGKMLGAEVPGQYVMVAAGASSAFLPYLLDRVASTRSGGLAGTLAFPLASTSVEYLRTVLSPYGSWGSVAYTQTDNVALIQLVSLTGLWGVTFLMTWFASAVNAAWEGGLGRPQVRGVLGPYAAVLTAVLLAGGARWAGAPSAVETVRVASLTVAPGPAEAIWRTLQGPPSEVEHAALRAATHALQQALLDGAGREAAAGARVVFWSELDGLVLEEDMQGFVDRGRALARTHGIYLFMAVGEFRPGRSWMRNSLVGIDPGGEVISTYDKARPVPGDPEKPGSGEVVVLTTPFGRIAQAICYDMDFPWLVRQAGTAGADWMLVPARDWKEIDSLHARMAMVRGVENGFAVVRQARGGISMAADRHGRVLARADDAGGHDPPLVVQVPIRGARTVYARVGDLFAWLSLAGLALLIVRRRSVRGAPAPSGVAARAGSA